MMEGHEQQATSIWIESGKGLAVGTKISVARRLVTRCKECF